MGTQFSKIDKRILIISFVRYSISINCLQSTVGLLVAGGIYMQQRSKSVELEILQTNVELEIKEDKAVVPQIVVEVEKSYENELINDNLIQRIQVQYRGNQLEWNTIKQILEICPELSQKEFARLASQSRKGRRAIRESNVIQYVDDVMMFVEQIEKTIEGSMTKLIQQLGISEQTFEMSVVALMQTQCIQEMMMIQQMNYQRLKEMIPSTQEVSVDKVKELIRYQVEILSGKPQAILMMLERYSMDQQFAQLIPQAINIIISDIIYDKYKYEEEDVIKVFMNPLILQDPSIRQNMMMLEQKMMELMGVQQGGMPDFEQFM